MIKFLKNNKYKLVLMFVMMLVNMTSLWAQYEVEVTDSPYHLRFLEKQTIMLFSMDKPVTIDKVIIDNKSIVNRNERASQIEILVSTIESDLDEDYISCGIFEIDPTEDSVICDFEPVEAKFIRVKILASWGADTGSIGNIKIGRSGARLYGRVLDSDSKLPINNCNLSILDGENLKSDDKGNFNFSYLKLGEYRILSSYSGYIPEITDVKIDSSHDRKINIYMKLGNTDLFGIIKDKYSHVLSGVDVTIKDSMKSVVSDNNGLYHFEKLNSGTISVIFSKKGYFTVEKSILIAVGLQTRLDIRLVAGEDNQPPVPLKLSPFAYNPNKPEELGYLSKTIYLIFDEPVGPSALNILNYKIEAYSGNSITGLITKLDKNDIMLTGVAFHRGDKSFKTIKFNVAYSDKVKNMPFIELTVKGVADKNGNVIPESGVTVKNFSIGYYKFDESSIDNNSEILIENGVGN